MDNNLDGRDEDWQELVYALEHFDVDTWSYAYSYIIDRLGDASVAYRDVLEAMVAVDKKHGKESEFYKSLDKQAQYMFALPDYTWNKMIYGAEWNIEKDGGDNLRTVIELADYYNVEADGYLGDKLDKIRKLHSELDN